VSLVIVKNKYQVVIPANVRQQAGIQIGDVLEASAQKGKIVFIPKTLAEREVAEGLQDIRNGRTYGPFSSAEKMIAALHKATGKKRKIRKSK
jgi:AbrB family looped-hinge helix DNA binding protein